MKLEIIKEDIKKKMSLDMKRGQIRARDGMIEKLAI